MNTPPNVPPRIPSPAAPPAPAPPPGATPEEREPVPNLLVALEALLRQPRRVIFQLRQARPGRLIGALLAGTIVCSLVYGLVLGAFSGGTQLWAAPVKVAAGLFLAALICLPSLYIFACLSGAQARLQEVVGLVAGMLLLMTVLLIGFAPVAWVFSQSTESVVVMGMLHLVFWAIGTYFGLRFLRSGFGVPEERSGGGLRVWMVIFLVVMLQMTTALRPLIGTADHLLPSEKKFFLNHWAECVEQAGRTHR